MQILQCRYGLDCKQTIQELFGRRTDKAHAMGQVAAGADLSFGAILHTMTSNSNVLSPEIISKTAISTSATPPASPRVSVIIPTVDRFELVQRAVRSVADQTVRDIEIIAVIDGPANPKMVSVLKSLHESRLKIIQAGHQLGAGAARNLAVSTAVGRWIAFLDDDDEWRQTKLERQLELWREETDIISCVCEAITPTGSYRWPRRPYDGTVPVDEYLFDRRSVFRGDSHIGTSTYLMTRLLFSRVGFGDSRQNEDTSLLLRLTKQEGSTIKVVSEPLVVLYKEEERDSLGSNFEWREMLMWLDNMGGLITRRAYSGFCLIYLGSQAAARGDLRAIPTLLGRALLRGRPNLYHLGLFASFWIISPQKRRFIRALIMKVTR